MLNTQIYHVACSVVWNHKGIYELPLCLKLRANAIISNNYLLFYGMISQRPQNVASGARSTLSSPGQIWWVSIIRKQEFHNYHLQQNDCWHIRYAYQCSKSFCTDPILIIIIYTLFGNNAPGGANKFFSTWMISRIYLAHPRIRWGWAS